MIWLVATAFAADPTNCDPRRDTASVSARGYCVDEATYVELGRLRSEVAALRDTVKAGEAEIAAFELWKAERDADFAETLQGIREEQFKRDLAARERLQLAEHRTFLERYGVAVGFGLGVATVIGSTVATIELMGVLNQNP